jgi:hypothetical protein
MAAQRDWSAKSVRFLGPMSPFHLCVPTVFCSVRQLGWAVVVGHLGGLVARRGADVTVGGSHAGAETLDE